MAEELVWNGPSRTVHLSQVRLALSCAPICFYVKSVFAPVIYSNSVMVSFSLSLS